MPETENIELGFIPVDAPPLPEEPYASTIVSIGGTDYEYAKSYSSLGDAYDIRNLIVDNLYVSGILSAPSFTAGFAITSRDVIGGIGSIKSLTVSGITTLGSNSSSLLNVNGDALFYDNVGIGSLIPQQRLDIAGSLKLSNLIYDVDGQAGAVGWFLSRDASGIRWTNIAPGFGANIIVLEEGSAITGSVGISSFSGINFISGSGASPYELVDLEVNPGNPLYADIYIKDFWTKNGSNIYRNSRIGINNSNPSYDLDVTGTARVTGAVYFDSTLDVDGNVTFNSSTSSTSKDTGALIITNGGVGIEENLNVGGYARINSSTSSTSKDTGALVITNGGVGIEENLNVGQKLNVSGDTTLSGFVLIDDNVIITGFTTGTISTSIYSNFSGISSYSDFSGVSTYSNFSGVSTYSNFSGIATFVNTTQTTNNANYYIPFVQNSISTIGETIRVDSGIKYNPSTNSATIDGNLTVGGVSVFDGSIELNSSLIDINGSTAIGKTDYRLASVGTGVSWRPPGVQTQNAIWVTMDGNDSNSGYLEGDAKRTIGAAASIAEPGDTIFIRSGIYYENNPIGLRTDVSVSGQDLRLVTIIPNNPTKDVFHVRRGCLVENVSFAGVSVSVGHTGCGAVAFPPTSPSNYAVSGYIAPGPATEGDTGRWKSPYIRNCTNFMTGSIGMRIDGNHATASSIGADLKSMVCDSFTQYNENGIGVSITNSGYAQLVSIFTINCDIGIYCDSGGSCDLTNSNSSFGNFGLVAVGLGSTEFTGIVSTYPSNRTQPGVDAGSDIVTFANMKDDSNAVRRPYDGQALFFKINLNNYGDVDQTYVAGLSTSILQEPMKLVQSIGISSGGSGFSPAAPPTVLILDADDNTQQPKGPQGIIAEVSPTIDPNTGSIIAIDVINSGRNYLPNQNLKVFIDGGVEVGAAATVITQPIYYTIDAATQVTEVSGITTVTFNEFIPYELFGGEQVSLKRISRILTSSHSFEYIGTGTNINTSTPFKGGVPIKDNEIVAKDGAQIPFTSTDQKGNFDIGEGFQINQPTGTIRGRDFSKAIQAELTPLILALR